MVGLRYYVKGSQLKALEAESRLLDISVNDLISLKLKRRELESFTSTRELENISFRLQKCELILIKLCELLQSGLIDTAFIRGVIEHENPNNKAATTLEAKRLEQSLKILEEVLTK